MIPALSKRAFIEEQAAQCGFCIAGMIDSGEIVNPHGVRNQIEGGMVQSASWTMGEAVGFDATRIISRDWRTYPVLRFPIFPRVLRCI
jgi:CO/xanthine dehydrogenase Mo-binding subunit